MQTGGKDLGRTGWVVVAWFRPGWGTAFLLATGLILTRLISEDGCLCLSLPKLIHVHYSTPYQKRRGSSLGDFHYYHGVERRCSERAQMMTRKIKGEKVSEAPRPTCMRVQSWVRLHATWTATGWARAAFVRFPVVLLQCPGEREMGIQHRT